METKTQKQRYFVIKRGQSAVSVSSSYNGGKRSLAFSRPLVSSKNIAHTLNITAL